MLKFLLFAKKDWKVRSDGNEKITIFTEKQIQRIYLFMAKILIKDTTPLERIQIVKDALDGEYDEFYDDYVEGKKELAELNSEYSEHIVWNDSDKTE